MPFIPEAEKQFAYSNGDLIIVHQTEKNQFAIMKVINVEKTVMKKGETKNIANYAIQAPEDDFFLVVSVKYSEYNIPSAEKAKEIIASGQIPWKFAHLPMRPSSWTSTPMELAGHEEVAKDELELFQEWKQLFDKGEAGVW